MNNHEEKQRYAKPQMEFYELGAEDIVRTSTNGDGINDDGTGGETIGGWG